MKRFISLAGLTALVVVLSGTVLRAEHSCEHAHTADVRVLLPIEQPGARQACLPPERAANAAAWREFRRNNGAWSVVLDAATQSPRQAFGPPVALPGVSAPDAANVAEASRAFLAANAAAFGIDTEALRFVRANLVNNTWYVSFRQHYQGLNVLFSEVELRINARAEVFAFRMDYYPGIELATRPAISAAQAARSAVAGTEGIVAGLKTSAADLQRADALAVLPVKREGGVDYRLVYRVPIHAPACANAYEALVDAHSGQLLRRVSQISHANSVVEITAQVRNGGGPLDPMATKALPDVYVTVGGTQYTTDRQGTLTVDIEHEAAVSFQLEGPGFSVETVGRDRAQFSGVLQAGDMLRFEWNDEYSHRYERNMYHHLHVIRDWVKNLDPDLTAMDVPITVQLWWSAHPFLGSSPNAVSMGETIAFIGLGDNSARMADGGSVLYHEYGHSLNNMMAQSLGGTFENATLQEGIADVVANFILDTPLTGLGVFTAEPERFIRTADNRMVYPDSIVGESHHDGQIISGAFWDLRKLVGLETATRLSHYARYGLPDDPDAGVAFSEWFMEVLIADDDDGNLDNGTPHCDEIITAFARHGIGPELLVRQSFAHTPVASTADTVNNYPLELSFAVVGLKGAQADSVTIVYATNTDATQKSLRAQSTGNGHFSTAIPAQKAGTIVFYDIIVWSGGNQLDFTPNGPQGYAYAFLVDYRQVYMQKFENADGWTIGAEGDDARGARWELADPEAMDFTPFGVSFILQPEDDHSPDGTRCLVTGPSGDLFTLDQHTVYSGTTTVTGPGIDISKLLRPVVRYYRWFNAFAQPIPGIPDPIFRVEMSADGGANWQQVEESTERGQRWQELLYIIPESVQSSTAFRMRFTVENPAVNLQAAAFADALLDDFEVLAVGPASPTSVETPRSAAEIDLRILPNPVEHSAEIRYTLERSASHVRLEIRDVLGRNVRGIALGPQDSGSHSFSWDARDTQGAALPAGIYYLHLIADGHAYGSQVSLRP